LAKTANHIAGYVLVLAVLVAAFGYWIYSAGPFDWHRFLQILRRADWAWLALAVFLIALSYVGRAVRWELMLRPIRPNPSFWGILSATAIGFTATVLFGRAGEFARPYLIARRENVSLSSQIAIWVAERIFDLLMVLALFGFGLAHVREIASPKTAMILQAGGWALGVMSVICLVVVGAFRFYHDGVRDRLMDALVVLPSAAHAKISKFLDSFGEGMLATRDTRSLLLLIGYSIIEWAILVASAYCTLRALPGLDTLSLSDSIVVLGFVAFGHSVQLPGIGGGGQVATLFVLTELYGKSAEVASAGALIMWIINILTIVPFGLVLAFVEGLHWNEMRGLEESSL
jgi:glycosyltransferase 2 family protein